MPAASAASEGGNILTARPLTAAATLLALALPAAATAGEAWDELRPMIYGERPIARAVGSVALTAPRRASDDREVPIAAEVALPEGEAIRAVSLIIDENPVPVSAVFELAEPRRAFSVLVNMRLDGPSPVRAVVETADGRLLMAERMVKTSGLGACAAPPVTDAEAALATLGEMEFFPAGGGGALAALSGGGDGAEARARLEIRHPSHSGLQMDQVSLLHIPAHFVEAVEVWQGGESSFRMAGSISLSEDPEIEFSLEPGAEPVRVRVTDTEGNVFERRFGPAGG